MGTNELERLSAAEGQLSCHFPGVAGSEVSIFAKRIFAENWEIIMEPTISKSCGGWDGLLSRIMPESIFLPA